MNVNLKKSAYVGLLSLAVVSCKTESEKDLAQTEEIPGINLEYMDTTVRAQDDFFRFVNGVWLDSTEIPSDRTIWGSFNELRKRTDEDALSILKGAMDDPQLDPASDQAKAVRLFESIMNTDARDSIGMAPIMPYLEKVEQISNVEELQQFLVEMGPKGLGNFFGIGVSADKKDSNINAAYLGVAGLGLPDRDYYLEEDERSVEIREKYVDHVSRMLQMVGVTAEEADAQAKNILAFETRLAEAMLDKVERRDPKTTYNPMAVSELQNMTPAIQWSSYFNEMGATDLDTIIVSQPKYMKTLQEVLAEGKVEDWKDFLRWSVINDAASNLTTEMDRANWEFYSKELRGAKEQLPLEERALSSINWTVGEALGKLYVDKKFPPEAKAKAQEMIANIIKAYENRINKLEWMDEDTKKKAIEKLNKTTIKVGYPDNWKDYSELEIVSVDEGGSYFENTLNIAQYNYRDNMEDLGQPVDKSEWFMAPQVVNAYYNPSYNEIVFPAAILQPPFYNFTADAAVNYGGIGAVIGHEISHGFDDSGADYDAEGNLVNWWTDEDLEEFNRLGDSLASQYDQLEVLPGVSVNGKFTLGENIGDLGGVSAAYDGLQIHLTEHGDPGLIDGFTPEQRFFMSWATVWRTKARDEALRNQVKTDPHSPGMFRAVQPLKNVDAFYTAFDIKEGDAMFLEPDKRVKIW
ncbi:M13 family metallopeptidase [Robertkochia aurantiaca]|uniref:M13 family metallopeptidase n=1 Tax=Robertkochia aurantiaca TaxID=2873700 RepID=UPI001CC97DE3|nr:M13 family metallopeptidase [Robertkochia sp. 3YJGBD-33]